MALRCFPFSPLPSSQIETGLWSIRSLLSEALPFHSEPYSVPIQAHLFQQLSPYKLSHLVTKHFKNFLRRKLNFEAREFLLQRFANVKWHFVASPQLFDMLHTTPLKIIPAASRLAILRWAIDSDPDFHFRLPPAPHPSHPLPMRLRQALITVPRGPFSRLSLLEPSYCSSYMDALSATSSSFTFPELSSFSPSLLPLLFRTYHNSLPSSALKPPRPVSSPIHIAYNRRRWAWPALPTPPRRSLASRELRLLLFGSSHTEIDLVSAHYQIPPLFLTQIWGIHYNIWRHMATILI